MTSSNKGATRSVQVGDVVLVVLTLDQGRVVDLTDVVPGVVDVRVDRVLEDHVVGIRRDQRLGGLLGSFEIMRSGMHLAAERQARRPERQLQQDLEKFVVGQRPNRNLNGGFVMTVEHDRNATRFEAFDRRGE